MPRIMFQDLAGLKPWMQRFVNPEKYTAYVTLGRELILEPLRSTSPMRFGYLRCENDQVFNQVLAHLRECRLNYFKIARYEWSPDRLPGANAPQEPEPAIESVY